MPQPERIQIELSAYLDGELDPPTARRVESLLARSPEARKTLESLRQARDAVASLPRRPAPQTLRSRIQRQVERLSLLEKPDARTRLAAGAWRGTLAAAAVLVAAVGLWWIFHMRPSSGASGPPAVARRPAPSVIPPPAPTPPARPAPTLAEAARSRADAGSAPGAAENTAAPAVPRVASPAPGRAHATPRVAAAPSGSAGLPGAAPALEAASAGPLVTMPRVEVIVQPRDAYQYEAARQVVSWWSRTPAVQQPQPAPVRKPQAESRSAQSDRVRIATVSGPSTPMRTRLLLDRLRAVAPEQVQVTLSFAPRDLDTVRAIIEESRSEPISQLLAALETPVSFVDQDALPEEQTALYGAPVLSPSRDGVLAMQAYTPGAKRSLARATRGKRDETVRLATLRAMNAGETALRWLEQAPEYARAARQTVEWTARKLLDQLRQELSPVRVDLKLMPPQRSGSHAPHDTRTP